MGRQHGGEDGIEAITTLAASRRLARATCRGAGLRGRLRGRDVCRRCSHAVRSVWSGQAVASRGPVSKSPEFLDFYALLQGYAAGKSGMICRVPAISAVRFAAPEI
jgi:hypothetical protein